VTILEFATDIGNMTSNHPYICLAMQPAYNVTYRLKIEESHTAYQAAVQLPHGVAYLSVPRQLLSQPIMHHAHPDELAFREAETMGPITFLDHRPQGHVHSQTGTLTQAQAHSARQATQRGAEVGSCLEPDCIS
jgi:hypothetical protein